VQFCVKTNIFDNRNTTQRFTVTSCCRHMKCLQVANVINFYFFVGNVYYLEDLGVDWRIILNWIFEKQDEDAQTGLIWLSIGTDGLLF